MCKPNVTLLLEVSLFIVMLNVVMLSVVMLNVNMPCRGARGSTFFTLAYLLLL
jgi:hypothetical protein